MRKHAVSKQYLRHGSGHSEQLAFLSIEHKDGRRKTVDCCEKKDCEAAGARRTNVIRAGITTANARTKTNKPATPTTKATTESTSFPAWTSGR